MSNAVNRESVPSTSAATPAPPAAPLAWTDRFVQRHVGPGGAEVAAMLQTCGYGSLDALMEAVVPAGIRLRTPLRRLSSIWMRWCGQDEPA